MEMQQIVDHVRTFDGVLVLAPEPGGPFPEIAWGDAFFYYAPDGAVPERTQPYGTIVTKDYPDDRASALDAPDRFRVNIHVGRERAGQLLLGEDPAASDALARHPQYGDAGWVSVVDPGSGTAALVLALLREAHDAARARTERRDRSGR
ncbi:DUF6194 family protein [Microbacterium sp. NPDC089698]|uniref:DUF6194 family protein n=1 Tax=Microbacterium sp. NPDC089698 TaxID=3364200 RepID=UPI003813EE37